jgi:hypothetical protein
MPERTIADLLKDPAVLKEMMRELDAKEDRLRDHFRWGVDKARPGSERTSYYVVEHKPMPDPVLIAQVKEKLRTRMGINLWKHL